MYTVYYPKSISRRLPNSVPGRGQLVHDDRDNSLAIGDGRTKFSELQKFSSGGSGGGSGASGLSIPTDRNPLTAGFNIQNPVLSNVYSYPEPFTYFDEKAWAEQAIHTNADLGEMGAVRFLADGLYHVGRGAMFVVPGSPTDVYCVSSSLLFDSSGQPIASLSESVENIQGADRSGNPTNLYYPSKSIVFTFSAKAGDLLVFYDQFSEYQSAIEVSSNMTITPLLQGA